MFSDETILITGGTGSFGQYMTKWLLENTDVPRILIFSRDEEKQLNMKREINDYRVDYAIGDVRDYNRVYEVIDTADVTIVFHAAALKIIDTGENFPSEVIKTNINGTENVARACSACDIKNAVLISTDKAVKPINLYGMTKGIAERIWTSQKSFCIFSVTRYGNIIGSRGSVIPYFQKLVKEGKPLPITSPEMTRFLLPLEHAIKAVINSMNYPDQILVPKIAAANIMDIAKAVGGENYPTKIIGIRRGEKIHECLINEDEMRSGELWGPDFISIGKIPESNICQIGEELTSDKARRLTVDEIKELIGND